jgi:hypothetical protein
VVLLLDILDYVGKGDTPLVGQLGGEIAEGFFSCFPWSYGMSVTSSSFEVVSSLRWVMSTSGGSFCPREDYN